MKTTTILALKLTLEIDDEELTEGEEINTDQAKNMVCDFLDVQRKHGGPVASGSEGADTMLDEIEQVEIWTVTEECDGDVLPWTTIYGSVDEAKDAVLKSLQDEAEYYTPDVSWGEFEDSGRENGTGWVNGSDNGGAEYILTRLA